MARRILPCALVFLLAACSEEPAPDVQVAAMEPVDSFHYWLQGIEVDTNDPGTDLPDLSILDTTSDGTDSTRLTNDEVSWFRGPDGLGTVLAYLSIGEAEDYRSYWDADWSDDPPAWLGPANPDWPGNYKVEYWNEDWRNLLVDQVTRLCGQGFDGAYLDIVDAYLYWSEEHSPENQRIDRDLAADRMLDLMAWLAEAGQEHCGGEFLMVPQNGEYLGRHAADDRSMALSSGLGTEDVYFPPDDGEWTDAALNPSDARINRMITFVGAGLPVLSIEYLTRPDLQANHDDLADPNGFLTGHFCRALDRSHENGPDPCPDP